MMARGGNVPTSGARRVRRACPDIRPSPPRPVLTSESGPAAEGARRRNLKPMADETEQVCCKLAELSDETEQVCYKLAELSASLEVETSVLRFWEKEFGRFIRPLKVGPRKKLYRRQDLELFQEIKRLLYEERFTIAGVAKRLEKIGGRQGRLFEESGDRLDAEPPPPTAGAAAAEARVLRRLLAETRSDLLALRAFLARPAEPEPSPTPPPAKARPKPFRAARKKKPPPHDDVLESD